MASIELKTYVHSQYGSGSSWNTATSYDGNNGNANTFYIGGSSDRYRARLYFTIPSSTVIAKSEKLVVKLAGYGQNGGTLWTARTRAYLSTTNLSTSDYSGWSKLSNPILSYLYSDAAGKNRITESHSSASGNNVYLIFNTTTLKAGTTYYIYLLPYSSDTAAINSPSWSNTWMQWKNNPTGSLSSLSVLLYYTNTVKITYNVNGGSGTISATTLTPGVAGKVTSSKPSPPDSTTVNAYTITYNADTGTCGTKTATNKKTTTYTFSNWNTKSDGSGTAYASGANITIKANTTLYARYKSSLTYSKLTAPVASKASTTETISLTYESYEGSISAPNFSETSRVVTYPFLGWYDTANNLIAQGNATFTPTATKTLIAKFGEQKSDFGAITLPTPPENEGLTFIGWKIDDTIYAAGDTIQITKNTTATAQWEHVMQSVCIYNSYSDKPVYTTEIAYGSTFTVPTYNKDQYKYENTNTGKYFTLRFYDSETDFEVAEDIPMRQTVQLADNLLVETRAVDGEYLPELDGVQQVQQTVPLGGTLDITKDTRLVMTFTPINTDAYYAIITVPVLKRAGYKISYWTSLIDSSKQFVFGTPTRLDLTAATNGKTYDIIPTWVRSTENDKNNLYFKVNGTYKIAQPYVKVSGQYVKGIATYVKVNGLWHCL